MGSSKYFRPTIIISLVACIAFAISGVFISNIGHLRNTLSEDVIFSSLPCNQSEARHDAEGYFYKYSCPSLRFYAFSAFYDDRASLLSRPVVRIIGISEPITELQKSNRSIFCVLHHSLGIDRVRMDPNPLKCGPGYLLGGIDADPYVFTCSVPDGMIPHCVAVEVGDPAGDGVVRCCMPVEYPVKRGQMKVDTPVVCVPVSYGNIDPIRLIEWVEIQKLLGVGMIAVYDLFLSEEARRVVRYYAESEGFIKLTKIRLIFWFDFHAHILELATSLNDCLYRHMHRFQRVIVSDFDEFIKPLKHPNLPELVQYLERTVAVKKSPNYIVRNNYYFLDLPPDPNMSKYLTFLRYRLKSVVSPPLHRVKPIILAESCTHMYSHECLGLTSFYSNRELHEQVDPRTALNQHYRLCPLTHSECKEAMINVTRDDTLLIYEDLISAKVREKVRAIMGKVPVDL